MWRAAWVAALAWMSGSAAMASVEPTGQICSMLLMDDECERMSLRLRQANSEAQRRHIFREYLEIVNERRRACPVAEIAKPVEYKWRLDSRPHLGKP